MIASHSTYPLLPFSQLVYDGTRWFPNVYMFRRTESIPGGAADIERWKKAVKDALDNHPVFSSGIDCQGQQYPIELKDILRGKYHHFSFCIDGNDLLIDARLSRILGDGRSAEILMEDVQSAYRGETLEPDDYWGYLEYMEQLKQSQHYADSKAWLENEFADESIPVRPTLDRHLWTLLSPKAGLVKTDFTDLCDKINQMAENEFLSMDGFFSLCASLAIAEYCGTNAAALTWAYEGRERPGEQRVFGSLHRDIPFQIKNLQSPISSLQSNLIREARIQIRTGIAHSDYPYTLTAPYNKRWNYAVNVLRVPEIENNSKYAYALLDVEIHEVSDGLALWYRYSATHYKESSILRFASLVRKYAEWLLS